MAKAKDEPAKVEPVKKFRVHGRSSLTGDKYDLVIERPEVSSPDAALRFVGEWFTNGLKAEPIQ